MCNECGYQHSEENDRMSLALCGDCLTSDCHHLNEIKREKAGK